MVITNVSGSGPALRRLQPWLMFPSLKKRRNKGQGSKQKQKCCCLLVRPLSMRPTHSSGHSHTGNVGRFYRNAELSLSRRCNATSPTTLLVSTCIPTTVQGQKIQDSQGLCAICTDCGRLSYTQLLPGQNPPVECPHP